MHAYARMGRLLYERATGHMKNHWPTDLGDIKPWKYFLIVAISLGLILGLSAPDSEAIPAWLITITWVVQSLITIGALLLVHRLVQATGIPKKVGNLTQLITSGVVAIVLLSPLLLWLDILLGNNSVPTSPQTLFLALGEETLGMGPPVIVAWLAMNAPFLAGFRLATTSIDEAPETALTPTFLQLVESEKKGKLLSLTAELHYLRVTTDAGKSLVLYNLRDAIAELPKDQGIQVHRSHWVSFNAIVSFSKHGRQGTLLLLNDDKIPVSRSQLNRIESVLAERLG